MTKKQGKWKLLTEHSGRRYSSITKQAKISKRLIPLKGDDVGQEEAVDYEALDKLRRRINQLAPIASLRIKITKLRYGSWHQQL